MSYSTIFITKGKSSLQNLIQEHTDLVVTALHKASDFNDLPTNSSLIILDLENEPGLIEKVLLAKNYQIFDKVPIWAVLSKEDYRLKNLFYSYGGTKIFNQNTIVKELKQFIPEEKEPQSRGANVTIPAQTAIADQFRLAEKLRMERTKRWIADLRSSGESFPKIAEEMLAKLFTLIEPHIALFLIADKQRASAFIMPDQRIFKEDYQDFKTFCLNDFFTHFQNLNLEDIDETFFLGHRTDFDKINMIKQKISSYIYFPIINKKGDVEATLHLGHLRNNYFSDKIIRLIQEYQAALNGTFFYAWRDYQTTIRQQKVLNIFSRFVPAEIIPELIMKEHQKEEEEVQKRVIAVLFSDIRSFTTITEQNSAQSVVDFLNRHFNVMVSIIKKHEGTIDKFIGDAIVAMFGVTVNFEENALRATQAAIEMIRALPSVECSGLTLKDNKYGIGIGIHEGPAIIGNVGSTEKADFTAIGDVINIAEELEGLTKHYGKPVLISETANNSIHDRLDIEYVDSIEVGNESTFKIFAPEIEEKDE